MKVQSHISSEDGKLFDVSLNTDEISFIIIELTKEEVYKLIEDIKVQIYLLEEEYIKK